jgi:septal ring factor EnvC (AmiA/AmiB activator)
MSLAIDVKDLEAAQRQVEGHITSVEATQDEVGKYLDDLEANVDSLLKAEHLHTTPASMTRDKTYRDLEAVYSQIARLRGDMRELIQDLNRHFEGGRGDVMDDLREVLDVQLSAMTDLETEAHALQHSAHAVGRALSRYA